MHRITPALIAAAITACSAQPAHQQKLVPIRATPAPPTPADCAALRDAANSLDPHAARIDGIPNNAAFLQALIRGQAAQCK